MVGFHELLQWQAQLAGRYLMVNSSLQAYLAPSELGPTVLHYCAAA